MPSPRRSEFALRRSECAENIAPLVRMLPDSWIVVSALCAAASAGIFLPRPSAAINRPVDCEHANGRTLTLHGNEGHTGTYSWTAMPRH